MSERVLSIREVGLVDYHVVVEHSARAWFGFGPRRTWVQHYRGHYTWRLYPQGTDLDALDPLGDWLDAYVEQYKWSQENWRAAE